MAWQQGGIEPDDPSQVIAAIDIGWASTVLTDVWHFFDGGMRAVCGNVESEWATELRLAPPSDAKVCRTCKRRADKRG